MKRALITGISGQDGAYLAKLLLDKGYWVCGASRDAQVATFHNLHRLGIRDRIQYASVALNDFRSVLQVLFKFEPEEVYHLAGQSSVALSFEQPVETQESIYGATLTLLEAIRFTGKPIRFYNAGSGECFGDLHGQAADENTPFHPRSPYAVARSAAYWQVANYREAYGLFACSGILFNHESPFRPERFVTKKIVAAATRIAAGRQKSLVLGNVEIRRDWGWAPEYVDAMHRMLQIDTPQDFVIATGQSEKLETFARVAFEHAGLKLEDHLVINGDLYRPTELMFGRGDAGKAAAILNWRPRYRMADVARMMVDAVRAELQEAEGASPN
ncbi:MAG: GDP-mannose 4,6-dehydratase [Verrucomicrobia bacterium]|nr:GDP-mannose 4,6-dehydratase [Verrucomicrobiota bacterium]